MENNNITVREIGSLIFELPKRKPFMLAQGLAEVYETTAGEINAAAKRNPDRFPYDFRFQLSDDEWEHLRLTKSIANASKIRFKPYGYFREGANMMATILGTKIAIKRTIQIIRGFSAIEERIQDELRRQANQGRQRKTIEWQAARQILVDQTKKKSDAVRALWQYAATNGSARPEAHYHMLYGRLIKSTLVEFTSKKMKGYREMLSIQQLQVVAVAEDIVDKMIFKEIEAGTYYKGKDGIYGAVKNRILEYVDIVGKVTPLQIESGNQLPLLEMSRAAL